ncbi:MAG: hypothetical protein ACQEQV_10770 [Fibrobacterota bacterium]
MKQYFHILAILIFAGTLLGEQVPQDSARHYNLTVLGKLGISNTLGGNQRDFWAEELNVYGLNMGVSGRWNITEKFGTYAGFSAARINGKFEGTQIGSMTVNSSSETYHLGSEKNVRAGLSVAPVKIKGQDLRLRAGFTGNFYTLGGCI